MAFYGGFVCEAELVRDVVAAGIVCGAVDLDALESFNFKSYFYQCANGFCGISPADVIHIDPVAYLAGIFADAVVQASSTKDLFFFFIEYAVYGVLAEVELTSELPDEFCHPVYFLRLFEGPGYPGEEVLGAAVDGGLQFCGVPGNVAADEEAGRFYFICLSEFQ